MTALTRPPSYGEARLPEPGTTFATTPTAPTVVTSTSAQRAAEFETVRAALAADYDVLEEIGRGGMAVVYRARERELDRDVAVKVLAPHLAFDESYVERFQREGKIAAQLEHPHIVPIYRVGRSGQVIYLVMKLLRGESLAARLAARGTLRPDEVRRVLVEVADTLRYAASRGVVHRDIKPQNIMLDEGDRCVVTDFGIARSGADSKLTAPGMSVGTPRYMSPEQARAQPLDGRSDLYSLGVVGYECLIGAPPFDGEDAFGILMAHVKAPVPRPTLRGPEERELFAVIEQMLAKDPADRFQSGADVIAALSAAPAALRPTVGPAGGAAALSPTRPTRSVADATELTAPTLREPHGLQLSAADARLSVFRVTTWAPRLAGAAARQARRVLGYGVSPRRRVAAAVAAVGLVAGSCYGAHFAANHRSRCPQPDDAPIVALQGDPEDPSSASTTSVRRRAFSIMLDAVGTQYVGGEMDVYYDVCGLHDGAAYTETVTLTKTESGFRRLLGRSVEPLRITYDETAGGPAIRRHRALDLTDMPAGSYWLELVVADGEGRRRTKGTGVRVLER